MGASYTYMDHVETGCHGGNWTDLTGDMF